jgi:hypothetical protein
MRLGGRCWICWQWRGRRLDKLYQKTHLVYEVYLGSLGNLQKLETKAEGLEPSSAKVQKRVASLAEKANALLKDVTSSGGNSAESGAFREQEMQDRQDQDKIESARKS